MSKELTTAKEMMLDASNPRERGILVEEREFALQQRRANVLASSTVVPSTYQGNIANCIIAMEMAQRLNAGELEIMQNLHVIHGRPSFSASYLIAQVNKSGVIRGRLRFRMTGEKNTDTWGCVAFGHDRETGELLEGTEVTIGMAKAEGWYTKNGSKWKTMPEQMLQYRAASFWSRVYAPDATMGMHTVEEAADIPERDITPVRNVVSVATSDLTAALQAKKSEVVDMQTGEVVEVAQEPQEAAQEPSADQPEPTQEEAQQSPAYLHLHAQLMKTTNEDEARKLSKLAPFLKLNQAERDTLSAAIENRCKAIAAGMIE